ncbi:MAG: DUF6325 family protein [Anaerolineae bacterium]|nr:DUF6325 family protein [Anaerolineae bacterium]
MTYGPIDFLAIEFKSSEFSAEIAKSLIELVEHDLIRIIDLVVVAKDENGVVTAVEVEQLDEDTLAIFEPLGSFVNGMVAIQDIELIGEMLENDSRAGLMLFENLWAVKFKEAVLREGGQLLMQERIPHEVVAEALVELATFD